jgi:hypothetical protein
MGASGVSQAQASGLDTLSSGIAPRLVTRRKAEQLARTHPRARPFPGTDDCAFGPGADVAGRTPWAAGLLGGVLEFFAFLF